MDTGWMRPIGRALRGFRAGMHGIASQRAWMAQVPEVISVRSPVFGQGNAIPERFAVDREGVSPPITWQGVPADAAELVLLVEDPDIPIPVPLVHGLVYAITPSLGGLAEGEIPRADKNASRTEFRIGRNSIGRHGWVPLSPPPGHGPHHYAFQIFALDEPLAFEWPPGRHALLETMRGHVIGRGLLFGIFERA